MAGARRRAGLTGSIALWRARIIIIVFVIVIIIICVIVIVIVIIFFARIIAITLATSPASSRVGHRQHPRPAARSSACAAVGCFEGWNDGRRMLDDDDGCHLRLFRKKRGV